MTSRFAGVSSMLLVAVTLLAMQAVAVARTPIDPEDRKQGIVIAPAIITSTGMDCRLADARHMGSRTVPRTKEKAEDKVNYYEIACKDAEGFVVALHSNAPTELYTCIEALTVKGAACQLPANADPKEALAPSWRRRA